MIEYMAETNGRHGGGGEIDPLSSMRLYCDLFSRIVQVLSAYRPSLLPHGGTIVTFVISGEWACVKDIVD